MIQAFKMYAFNSLKGFHIIIKSSMKKYFKKFTYLILHHDKSKGTKIHNKLHARKILNIYQLTLHFFNATA